MPVRVAQILIGLSHNLAARDIKIFLVLFALILRTNSPFRRSAIQVRGLGTYPTLEVFLKKKKILLAVKLPKTIRN